jgi:hypothetical protein
VTPAGRHGLARRARSDGAQHQRVELVRAARPLPGRHFLGVVPAQRLKARTKALASA